VLSLIDDCFSIGRQSASRKRMEQVRIPIGGSFTSLLKTPSQILRGYDSLFLTEDRSCAEVLKIRDICFHT
jgi:hypothetical protein